MMQENIHNKMAQFAYHSVSKIAKNNKEFRSLARSFPSMIQINGLSAATVYLYSKSKGKGNAHGQLYSIINSWFLNGAFQLSVSEEGLMKQIVSMDSGEYRLYVDEVMNLCLWIKRFAEGMIEAGKDGENDG